MRKIKNIGERNIVKAIAFSFTFKRFFPFLAFVGIFAITAGCSQSLQPHIALTRTQHYDQKIPLKAAYQIDEQLKSKVIHWEKALYKMSIPIGDFVHKDMMPSLSDLFAEFHEATALNQKSGQDIVIKVEDIRHAYLANRGAYGLKISFKLGLVFTVENSQGKQVFRKEYQQEGACELRSRLLRSSTRGIYNPSHDEASREIHSVIERILVGFAEDIQQDYKKWEL